MKRWTRLLASLALVAASTAASAYTIRETKSNTDLDLYVSPSGTPTKSLSVVGTTGVVSAPVGFLVNGTSLTGTFGAPKLQVASTANGAAMLSRDSVDNGGPTLEMLKRRTAFGVVSSGDRVGTLGFTAADGVDAANVASIVAEVDGTPGSDDMPGRLMFMTTADGAAGSTEHMRIDNAGIMLYTVPTVSGTNVRTSLANGQIMFANNNDSSVSPSISGRGVSGRNGLVITSFVDPASNAPDQQYQVLSSTASTLASGGLTNKAYIWYADGTEIGSLTRAGSFTIGVTTAGFVGNQIAGTRSGNSASAGYVGEYMESLFDGTTAAASGSLVQVASLPLTAGDWDVSGFANLEYTGSTTATLNNAGYEMDMSTTTASSSGTTVGKSRVFCTMPNNSGATGAGGRPVVCVLPRQQITISGSTTYFLNAAATYGGSAPTWEGQFSARRVR